MLPTSLAAQNGIPQEDTVEGDHPGRLWGGEDLPHEPVCQQEVQQPVQGHHRCRLSY